MVRLSFRIAAEKGLGKKKMKRSKAKRNIRALSKPDSKPVAVVIPELPRDVLMQILARLPANLLMRLKCMSRLWYSMISSPYFANLFLKTPSHLRERRLYLVEQDAQGNYELYSILSEKDPIKVYRFDHVTIPGMGGHVTIHGMGGGCLVNALGGLMCSRIGTRVRICNLTTKQQVELPLVLSGDDSNMWNHFGYDPIQEEYKVISLTWEMAQERVVRSDHHVLVLGPGASWRRITQSFPPHRPYSQGISIDRHLYYGAWAADKTCVVVSFDMTSETFILIKLPVEAGIVWDTRATNLMNYRGKLAVFDYSCLERQDRMDLWVFEDDHQLWTKKIFSLPISDLYFTNFMGDLFVQGTSHEGEDARKEKGSGDMIGEDRRRRREEERNGRSIA
ncbi:putative F-box protein At3g52320 isoform X1 [Raphanus sativus]|uniref:F-box protein At3g52320 isoform X1 n=1 Tax=Raphanus sativus TaxID=3726 RepID=A0A9W3C0T6_RAPSA|nr:putative F-box protein At3g52320 isoform X1 [Raphanus sativus]